MIVVDQAKWFILLTEPQREVTAIAGLVARRIKAYGPVEHRRVVRRGRKLEIEAPLFPGYVFARMTEGVDDFGLPKRVAGVRDYLRFNGVPCAIPLPLIEAIEQRENLELERFQRRQDAASFAVGENVRVAEGPFARFAAEVFKLDPKGRIEVLVNIFGRKTKVQFDAEQLEKV
jgi:transcriptional antiterminator NusG